MGGWDLIVLLGFGVAMEEALLPSKWLASLFAGVPAVGEPGEQAPPEREGLAAGRALLLDYMHGPFQGRMSVRGSFFGLCPRGGTTGPGIQLWPHSLTNDVLVCRSPQEPRFRHPPRRSALTLAMRSELRDGSLWGAHGPRVQLLSPLVQSPCAPRPWIPDYSGMTGGMAGEGWD